MHYVVCALEISWPAQPIATTCAHRPPQNVATLALQSPSTSARVIDAVSCFSNVVVGLGNIVRTTDANKCVSTAMQSALDMQADETTTYTKTDSLYKSLKG